MSVISKSICLVVYLSVFVISNVAFAQTRGLIWEVKKHDEQDLSGKVYLMGSIHFGDESFYPLSNNINRAYETSSVLYVEVDEKKLSVAEQQALIQKYTYYPEGETLRDHLSKEMITLFETSLAEFGVSLSAVEQQKPSYVGLVLAGLQAARLGYQSHLGVDSYFLQKARNKKPIKQIETFEQQLKLVSNLPSDDASLKDSFADASDYQASWKNMIDAWKLGDAQALYQEVIANSLKQYPGLKNYFELLFFNRNTAMAQTAEHCIKNKEACFIVVGAGHLVGERGVVDLLKNKGYSIRQL